MNDSQPLTGQSAVVTGGGSGIGAAIARVLAGAGADVAIVGRREETLAAVAASVAPPMRPLRYHTCDVASRQSVEDCFSWAHRQFDHIDILVNSAGINVPNRSSVDLTPEDWDRVLQINATGAFNCIYQVLPGMRERRRGLIVNICSVAGIRTGALGGVAYNASKFAMAALGRSIGEEERDHGIRVTTIYPGEVETPILDARPAPVPDEHRARILQPEDLAASVLMVACLPQRARVPELVMIPTSQSFT